MSLLSRIVIIITLSASLLLIGTLSPLITSHISLRENTPLILSPAQKAQLQSINAPITIYAYFSRRQIGRAIQKELNTIKTYLPNYTLKTINPDTQPIEAHRHNIQQEGALYIEIGENENARGMRLDFPSSTGIIRALLLLSQEQEEKQILHLQGNHERSAFADETGAWQNLYQSLNNPLYQIYSPDLRRIINIPEDTHLLIIADPIPQSAHLNAALKTYLANGGNLLYTTDTQHPHLPEILEELSGLTLKKGEIVDARSREFGFDDPRIIPAAIAAKHPITQNLQQSPILFGAVLLYPENPPQDGFQRQIILESSAQSWNETAPISGHISQDIENDEIAGPLPLAWHLQRPYQTQNQHIIILADSDLFSQNALKQGGNLALAHSIINHILHPESASITLEPPVLKDQFIVLSKSATLIWAIALIFILPALSVLIHHRLRKRFIKLGIRTP